MVVDRFKMMVRGTYDVLGRRDAVQFKIETDEHLKNPVFLTTVGLYGTMLEEMIEVGVTTLHDKNILRFFSVKWESDMNPHMVMVTLPHPLAVLSMNSYIFYQEVLGSGFISQGHGGNSDIILSLPVDTKARVVFSKSLQMGQMS